MTGATTRARATPLDGVDVLLADLDGVVYTGEGAVPHSVDSILRAQASGRRIGYITNNASRTDAAVAQQLSGLGLPTAPSDIVTSPQAAARLMRGLIPPGATVLVVGGEGLVTEMEKAGFAVTRSARDEPAAVVQGFAPHVAWSDLAEAAYALQTPREGGGIPWIATNTDWTLPQARGIAPGNGTLVSAVHTAVGRLATVAGKPETPIFEEAVARFQARCAAVPRRSTRHRHRRRAGRGNPIRPGADGRGPAQACARGATDLPTDLRARGPAGAVGAVPRNPD